MTSMMMMIMMMIMMMMMVMIMIMMMMVMMMNVVFQGPVQCYNETKTLVVDTPVEECELEPRQNCRHATKQVPKLVSVQVMIITISLLLYF